MRVSGLEYMYVRFGVVWFRWGGGGRGWARGFALDNRSWEFVVHCCTSAVSFYLVVGPTFVQILLAHIDVSVKF